MVQSVIPLHAPTNAVAVSVPVAQTCADLLELFDGVSDGRSNQGRDHPVAAVLALAAAATVAGMSGYTVISGWIADVPTSVLTDLYRGVGAAPARPPSKATIWRVLTDTDPEAFDAAIGTWLMTKLTRDASTDQSDPAPGGRLQVRLDGKTLRGAIDAEGNQMHLLAALAGPAGSSSRDAVIAAQAIVPGAKPMETTVATTVLASLDLSGAVVTADALHTVKATAAYIHDHGGEFVLPVKENRRSLFDALDALPWKDIPIAYRTVDKGHGRIATRTIQVLPAPANLPFPHVSQVWLIERYVTDTAGVPVSAVAQLGVASLTVDQAGPRALARPGMSKASGLSRSCTGSVTRATAKTIPRCVPDLDLA